MDIKTEPRKPAAQVAVSADTKGLEPHVTKLTRISLHRGVVHLASPSTSMRCGW